MFITALHYLSNGRHVTLNYSPKYGSCWPAPSFMHVLWYCKVNKSTINITMSPSWYNRYSTSLTGPEQLPAVANPDPGIPKVRELTSLVYISDLILSEEDNTRRLGERCGWTAGHWRPGHDNGL